MSNTPFSFIVSTVGFIYMHIIFFLSACDDFWCELGFFSGYLGPSTNITTVLYLLILAGNSRLGSGSLLAFTAVTREFQPFSFQICTSLVPPCHDQQNILSERALSRRLKIGNSATILASGQGFQNWLTSVTWYSSYINCNICKYPYCYRYYNFCSLAF